jgi:hypothetical protein
MGCSDNGAVLAQRRGPGRLVITDSDGTRISVIHWTDGVDSQIGIQALGVGNVLRLDPDAARRLADELKRHYLLVCRAAAELPFNAAAAGEFGFPGDSPGIAGGDVVSTGHRAAPGRGGLDDGCWRLGVHDLRRVRVRLVTGTILNRLMSPEPEQNSFGHTCYGLWTGDDGMTPPDWNGHTFDSTHTHYQTSGSTDIDSGDIEDAVRHIREHGRGLLDSNEKLIALVNEAESEDIQSWRAWRTPTTRSPSGTSSPPSISPRSCCRVLERWSEPTAR